MPPLSSNARGSPSATALEQCPGSRDVSRGSAVALAGASGGVVTALLGDLLEQGAINGAVVLAAHPRAPWRPWPRIARTRAEILRAAQSKYCVTPTNVILADIDPGRDRLALVALPCQVHALRALAARRHPALRAVSLIVGLYCGNQLHFGATRSFLRRHGVRDLSTVAELRYRDGAWPGQVRCTLTDGRTCAVPKFDFNHLISFYVLDRCLLCTDLAAEGADLSVADAWDAGGRMQGGAGIPPNFEPVFENEYGALYRNPDPVEHARTPLAPAVDRTRLLILAAAVCLLPLTATALAELRNPPAAPAQRWDDGPGIGRPGLGGPGFGPGQFLGKGFVRAADSDRNGLASLGEFRALAQRWFERWDGNRSGVLDLDEFAQGWSAALGPPGPGGPPDGPPDGGPASFFARRLFSACDGDADGRVAPEELVAAFERWFREWDTRSSGALDPGDVGTGLERLLGVPGAPEGPPGPVGSPPGL